jgi:hypothetical protein
VTGIIIQKNQHNHLSDRGAAQRRLIGFSLFATTSMLLVH